MVILLLDPHVEEGEKSGFFFVGEGGGEFFSRHFYVYVCIHVFPHIGIFGQKKGGEEGIFARKFLLPPLFFDESCEDSETRD